MEIKKAFVKGFAAGLEKQAGVGVAVAKGVERTAKSVSKHMPGIGDLIKKHPGKVGLLAGALGTAAFLHATHRDGNY